MNELNVDRRKGKEGFWWNNKRVPAYESDIKSGLIPTTVWAVDSQTRQGGLSHSVCGIKEIESAFSGTFALLSFPAQTTFYTHNI